MQNLKINNKGITFIVALIVVAIMSVNLVLFSMLILGNAFEARKEVNSIAALYVAEGGANMALRNLQQGGDGNIGETPFGDGTYKVDTTYVDTNRWVISSTGKVKGQSRVVRLNISTPPKVAFNYGVFTDGIQEYSGGGSSDADAVVSKGNVHSNNATPHINNPSHLIVGSGYTHPIKGPDYGFPELDIKYYKTVANNYYNDKTDEEREKLNNIAMPNGGITLVELTGVEGGRDISVTTGNGLLIVIGGDVSMSGNDTFTGLIYVNMNENGKGGNVSIGGTSSVTGGVVSRTANTIHGTNSVTYSATAINIGALHVDTDKITVYSWQSS